MPSKINTATDCNGRRLWRYCIGKVIGVADMGDEEYEITDFPYANSNGESTLHVRSRKYGDKHIHKIKSYQFERRPNGFNSRGEAFYVDDYVWDGLGRKYLILECWSKNARVMELLDTRAGNSYIMDLDGLYPKPRCVDSDGNPIAIGDVVEAVEDGD